MKKQLSIIISLLFLSLPAWSQQILDYESSFAVELDKTTGMWTVECEIELNDIDPFEDHRIYATMEYQISGTTSIHIAVSYFDILGDERSKSELTSGEFAFEAKKMGDRLTVGINLSYPAAGVPQGEAFICGINAYQLQDEPPGYAGSARMHVTQGVFSY